MKRETILKWMLVVIMGIMMIAMPINAYATDDLLDYNDLLVDEEEITPISIKTPFGASIYEKEEGSEFMYRIKQNKFIGTIDKIYGLSIKDEKVKTR